MTQRTLALFLGVFALFSTQQLTAQKMNILDYHKAFVDNTLSPNNSLLSKYSPQWIEKDGGVFLQEKLGSETIETELFVNADRSYIKYKRRQSFGKWIEFKNGHTFKLYTRADGKQILAVTEDTYSHHGYRSKYRPEDQGNTSEGSRLIRGWKREGKTEAEIEVLMEEYQMKNSPQFQWDVRPKPIKFWSYDGGAWKDITDEVMGEDVWITFEQLIVSSTDLVKAEDMDYFLKKFILGSDGMYPLYRLDPNTNDITVWVDHNHLQKITDKVDQSDSPGVGEDTWLVYEQVIAGRYGEEIGRLVDFIYKTKFRTIILSFDAKSGKFVRKK